MKKRILVVAFSVCMMGLSLMGCGNNDTKPADAVNTTDETKKTKDSEATAESEGYVFEIDGVTVAVDMDMSTIADKLGEPVSYFEEPSCAAQGIAKLYTFASYEIDTYPDGDKDLVACIILKDDNVATPEGIDLSKTKADVIATYGEDYEETEGCLTYKKGDMKLCFILDGENLASIQYISSVLD